MTEPALPPTDPQALAAANTPNYPERANIVLAVVAIVLILAPPIAALMNIEHGGLITYLLPWAFWFLIAVRWSAVDARRRDTYYLGVKETYGLTQAQFEALWRDKSPSSSTLMAATLVSMAYLVITYIVDFIRSDDILGYQGNGLWFAIARVALLGVSLAAALLLAMMPVFACQDDTKVPPVAETSTSLLQLQERDRNDIQIIGIEVELSTLSKRVEAYTLESTLLSALAFSAFITIQYSGKELEKLDFSLLYACLSLASLKTCQATALGFIVTHTKALTCLWLLGCSISFLAVLVARLRFNEAHRYNDEIVKIAQKLNDRENAAPAGESDLVKALTEEIANLLRRAQLGMSYLKPMISFIKFLRDIGVICFILAIATCGLQFAHWVGPTILAFFFVAYLLGHGDRIRHEIGFMPHLKSTIMAVIQRAR
ncbi:MAG: hypothetical protein QM608_11985 [Caulobacter sp.]